MLTSTKRILKAGWVNFSRNSVVSMASVLIMTITLFVIISLIFTQAILYSSLAQVKDKVDITVYFNLGSPENKIISLKEAIEQMPQVKGVTYVPDTEALAQFKTKHQNDYLILQGLDELDDNPLSAYLNIKAKDISQYESIADVLWGDSALAKDNVSIIKKVDYHQNKIIIDRLITLIDGAQKLGLLITAMLVLISIIITFNTIRLTIYISREEIGIMKLVGATSKFVRGPFLIEGALYGLIATIITIGAFFPITLWLGNHMTQFLGINLFSYYLANFFQILIIVLVSGVLLGIISSFLAVSKYIQK